MTRAGSRSSPAEAAVKEAVVEEKSLGGKEGDGEKVVLESQKSPKGPPKKEKDKAPTFGVLTLKRDERALTITVRLDTEESKGVLEDLDEALANYANSLTDYAGDLVREANRSRSAAKIVDRLMLAEDVYSYSLEFEEGFRSEACGKWMTLLHIDAAAVAYRLGYRAKGSQRLDKAKEWLAKLKADDERRFHPPVEWNGWKKIESGLERAQKELNRRVTAEGLRRLSAVQERVRVYDT